MSGGNTHSGQDASWGPRETNAPFFLNYGWCLNPILSVGELMERMEEEVGRHPSLERQWQKEESIVNIYLFASAISCALADYLARRPWRLAPIGNLFPKFKWLVGIVDGLANFPATLHTFLVLGPIRKWKVEWDALLERVCGLLLSGPDASIEELSEMYELCDQLRSRKRALNILDERMKLNEGFRCQDLTHHDIVTLAQRYLSGIRDKQGKFVIVGARTAGSYIAPLVKVVLQQNGIRNVSWMTVRPKFGPFGREKRRMRHLFRSGVNAILVDDYSNTGDTFKALEANVLSCGVPARDITMLAPIHPAKSKGELRSNENTKVIVLETSDLFIKHMLEPESAGMLLKDLLSCNGVAEVKLSESHSTKILNERLWSHYPDSFQVRLKRVYDVAVHRKNGSVEKGRVIAKSVGLGWLGYHAILAGKELTGFVPRIFGLRNGIIFMDWLSGEPLSPGHLSGEALDRMGSYLANRTEKLSLDADRRSAPPFLSWGWLELLSIFRRVYGNLPGYLKHEVLLRRLKQSIDSKPTLIDGRMCPSEWLSADGCTFKIDFEQHSFGPPERDVVDPAYDIATASFEFHMTEEEERRLTLDYLETSGDAATLPDRIFLYKLLYGMSEGKKARLRLLSSDKEAARRELNRRLVWSWDFLVFSMNRYCADLIGERSTVRDPDGIFFMDLDGVFDSLVFGFPHTTVSGLEAISLLRSDGYDIIPNTGRSVEHVRSYCRSYGFSAGIGEFGGVCYDSKRNLEIPLVSPEVVEELDVCREALKKKTGVFVDPGYRYAVRSYHYTSDGSRALDRTEGETILKDLGLRDLKMISRDVDTYFVEKDRGKGSAVEFFKDYSNHTAGKTLAVGDSDEDIPMLRKVAHSYAPSNCSAQIRKLSRDLKCDVVSRSRQKGLLQIAEKVTGVHRRSSFDEAVGPRKGSRFDDFMVSLLTIAEAPRYRKLLYLLDRRGLGFGIDGR